MSELRASGDHQSMDRDPDLADRWLAAQHDAAAVEAFGRDVLDRLGGPLFDGHQAVAPRPKTTETTKTTAFTEATESTPGAKVTPPA